MKFEVKQALQEMQHFVRENRSTVWALFLAVLLLVAVQMLQARGENRIYCSGETGDLAALHIPKTARGKSVPLMIEAEKDGVRTKVEVILSFEPKTDKGQAVSKTTSAEDALKAALRALAGELETQEGEQILLPRRLEDGTTLRWSRSGTSRWILTVLLFPLLTTGLYMQKREKEKVERKRIRDGILRELPAFSGQLLLLLNSGMIFSDAFARIEDGYRKGRRQSPFAQEVIWIRRQAEETGKSLVAVMQTRAASLRLREFSRIAAMISDSQYKGVDLSDKLESERLLLWEQRKKLAEAKGKAAETKLAFPLALLLLVLILITAAPAILQM